MQIVCMRKVTNIRTITFNFQKHNKVAYRSYRWVANSTLNFHFIFLLQEALSATHMSELLRLQQGACINQSFAIHSSSVPFLRMVCSFAKQSVTLRWNGTPQLFSILRVLVGISKFLKESLSCQITRISVRGAIKVPGCTHPVELFNATTSEPSS